MTLRERAMAATPGGAQTRSKRATAFPLGFPQFLIRGKGARVCDDAGRIYIDWICGLASISLGYQYKPVDDAVRFQMSRGVSFSLPTELEVETAERLREMLPLADMVRFCKTGSEATEGAMRMARIATGRDTIISIGYHGWHTAHDEAIEPRQPGIPYAYHTRITSVPWGNTQALIEKFDTFPTSIAAVLVEVMRDDPPPKDYAEVLRDLCNRHGALLIFDEIVTGFRWAVGGASEFFGVLPDLACYGKGLANGYPLAAIVGRGDLMEHATYVSGTYGGECLSLAACLATLKVYRDESVIKHGWDIGSILMDAFNAMASGTGLAMRGYAVHPRIVGDRRDAFIAAVAREGVLFHPAGFNVSYSHGMAEVEETLRACKVALGSL